MDVGEVMREGIFVALKIGAPLLLLSMLAGVAVAIFQAVTQIHEQTIAFTLKLTIIVIICLSFGGKMLDTLVAYAQHLFNLML